MSRQYCLNCTKPQAACICAYLQPQVNQVAVIVLQHPDEKSKAIGTAPLIKLGLSKSRIISSVAVSEADLNSVLTEMHCSRPLLIYPTPLSEQAEHAIYDFEKDRSTLSCLNKVHDCIILLDGTWRNTRELLHCNPWIKELPSLQLKNAGESHYRIRQAQKPGALATIEAVAKVLSLMESDFQSEKLLFAFEKMIEFQIQKMGQDVYQKNYAKHNQ